MTTGERLAKGEAERIVREFRHAPYPEAFPLLSQRIQEAILAAMDHRITPDGIIVSPYTEEKKQAMHEFLDAPCIPEDEQG